MEDILNIIKKLEVFYNNPEITLNIYSDGSGYLQTSEVEFTTTGDFENVFHLIEFDTLDEFKQKAGLKLLEL